MRKVLLISTLLFLFGCESSRDIIDPGIFSISGIWNGNFAATYPGTDDSPITVKDSILFKFTDKRFAYYWIGSGDTSAAGRGSYYIESNVIFSNEIESQTNPPITIDGAFSLRIIRPDTVILSQGSNPDLNSLFEITYLITLVKSAEVTE